MASLTESVVRRVQHALGFGRTSTEADDTGPVQTVQVQRNGLQTVDAVPVVFAWGFFSVAPAGATPVHLSAAGDLANGVILAHAHPASRPTGQARGVSGIYDLAGSMVRLNGDGTATLIMGGTSIATLTAEGVTFTVPITAPDFISSEHGYTFNGHKHGDVENGAGQTSVPDA